MRAVTEPLVPTLLSMSVRLAHKAQIASGHRAAVCHGAAPKQAWGAGLDAGRARRSSPLDARAVSPAAAAVNTAKHASDRSLGDGQVDPIEDRLAAEGFTQLAY